MKKVRRRRPGSAPRERHRKGGRSSPRLRLRPQDTGLAASVGIRAFPCTGACGLACFSPSTSGDAGRPAAARAHLQLQPFHTERPRPRLRLRSARLRIVPDTLEATRAVLKRAAGECDVIVTREGCRWATRIRQAAVEAEVRSSCGDRHEARTALAFGKVAMRPSSACRATRCPVRHLPHLRAPVPAEDAGHLAGHAARHSGARRFRWGDRRAARIPARKMQCTGGLICCNPGLGVLTSRPGRRPVGQLANHAIRKATWCANAVSELYG